MMARVHLIRWIVAGIALIAVGAGAGYWWAQRHMPNTPASASAPGERKVLYWHDPMVPNVKFDKPGKSPFMDMQLVPVYAGEEQGGVRVSAAAAQNLGIRLGRVERAAIGGRVSAVGSVTFDERLLELVQPRVEGYVTRLHVKSTQETVRRGQRLAEILAPEWLEAEQEYLALLDASAERAQVLRDAARQRLAVLGVPEATIRDIEKTRKTNATATLFAPIDGVVTELDARQGAAFMPGATLFRINGLSTVWVNAQVPEAKASAVPVGASVEARATGWPGAKFEGKVIALLPQVDPQTRTLTARVAIDNKDRKLSPGMFVTLDLHAPEAEPQLVVPSEAIISTGERNVIIATREGGGFDVLNVELGSEQDGRTVVLSGVSEGQSVVLSGQFLIDSEASLKSGSNRLEAGSAPDATMPEMSKSAPPGASANPAEHTTRGTVTEIGADTITLSHDPVPSLDWPAMTMGFELPADGLPKDIKVGDRVSFSFAQSDGGSFRVESITRIGPESEKPQ